MPGGAGRTGSSYARREKGHRGRVFLRVDACRGRGTFESAARHRENPHPFGIAQAATGAGRERQRIMSRASDRTHCAQSELVCAYALHALPARDVAAIEAHVASCAQCRQELQAMRPVVDSFSSWPTDVLRPAPSLQARLARRIAEEAGGKPVLPSARKWQEPEWEQVAP